MSHTLPVFSFVMLVFLSGCQYMSQVNRNDKADLIARVGEDRLYASELTQVTVGLSGKDSLQALRSYADQWVKRKVLLQKALDNIRESDLNIEGLVQSYKESLILFEYEKELVYEKLDTVLQQAEIDAYYEEHKDGFILPRDMYQVYYIKLPTDAPDLKQARSWILKPADEEDVIMAEGYCKQFSSGFEMNNALWMDVDQIQERFKVSPSSLQSSGVFREYRVEDGLLYLKISEIFRQGSIAPVAFVSDEIRKIILEKRKGELIDRIYRKVYQDAVQDGNAEMFIR